MWHRASIGTLVILLTVGSASMAAGQTPQTSTATAPRALARLSAGTRVWVTTADGREVNGRVVSVSGTTITLRAPVVTSTSGATAQAPGTNTTLSLADVRHVDAMTVTHCLIWGAVIGTGAMAVPGWITGAVSHNEGTGSFAGPFLAITAIGAGIGAGIGALIDHSHVRHRVYDAPGTVHFVVAPVIVGGRSAGVMATVRW